MPSLKRTKEQKFSEGLEEFCGEEMQPYVALNAEGQLKDLPQAKPFADAESKDGKEKTGRRKPWLQRLGSLFQF